MSFEKDDRVEHKGRPGIPGRVREVLETDRETLYWIDWEDRSSSGPYEWEDLRPMLREMRTFCYRSPYPLMLTPEDADITDLLGAVLNLSMTYEEHKRTYSTEVMQAVGAVVALAKRSLKEEA